MIRDFGGAEGRRPAQPPAANAHRRPPVGPHGVARGRSGLPGHRRSEVDRGDGPGGPQPGLAAPWRSHESSPHRRGRRGRERHRRGRERHRRGPQRSRKLRPRVRSGLRTAECERATRGALLPSGAHDGRGPASR